MSSMTALATINCPTGGIGRHSQTRRRKTRPARDGGLDRLPLREGQPHPDPEGKDGPGDRDEDGTNARLFDEPHVQLDARLDQEQDQAQVSQEDHGLREGDVVGELRAQEEAGDDLSDERRNSDVKGDFSEDVGHAEEDEDVVGVFVGHFDGEFFGQVFLLLGLAGGGGGGVSVAAFAAFGEFSNIWRSLIGIGIKIVNGLVGIVENGLDDDVEEVDEEEEIDDEEEEEEFDGTLSRRGVSNGHGRSSDVTKASFPRRLLKLPREYDGDEEVASCIAGISQAETTATSPTTASALARSRSEILFDASSRLVQVPWKECHAMDIKKADVMATRSRRFDADDADEDSSTMGLPSLVVLVKEVGSLEDSSSASTSTEAEGGGGEDRWGAITSFRSN
ncbi:hypothetical protein ACHAXS_009336 [Conticribra weissflogii]